MSRGEISEQRISIGGFLHSEIKLLSACWVKATVLMKGFFFLFLFFSGLLKALHNVFQRIRTHSFTDWHVHTLMSFTTGPLGLEMVWAFWTVTFDLNTFRVNAHSFCSWQGWNTDFIILHVSVTVVESLGLDTQTGCSMPYTHLPQTVPGVVSNSHHVGEWVPVFILLLICFCFCTRGKGGAHFPW